MTSLFFLVNMDLRLREGLSSSIYLHLEPAVSDNALWTIEKLSIVHGSLSQSMYFPFLLSGIDKLRRELISKKLGSKKNWTGSSNSLPEFNLGSRAQITKISETLPGYRAP
jgi:hypothetical protein